MARGRNRQKKKVPATTSNFPENEDNFREYSLNPEYKDINSSELNLCPLKITGPYRSVEHYLDVHFKVLREDFISPLRQAIRIYKQQPKTEEGFRKINNIEIYKNVKFLTSSKVCFDVDNEIAGIKWETTKKFMSGSLLIFTNDDFHSFLLATVANTDIIELKNKLVNVELINKNEDSNFVVAQNNHFTMIESESFFTPYFYVLKTLQELDESNFPFKEYFVDLNKKINRPNYLNNFEVYNISEGVQQYRFRVLFDLEWPTNNQIGLDPTQFRAFKAALTNDLAVIQGPPGSGKTFIGLKIVQALLENSQVWNNNSTPILIVCYTNRALDKFLEGLLAFTNRLVRIGLNEGGKLENFNLREKRRHYGSRQTEMDKDLQILRSALVVGTTTTQAAKQRQLFTSLAPKIVIVEEAAEVLEAHVIASLTVRCQHLIMIGDHKQLRPNVSDQRVRQQYKLDVSLFERLIKNGMPFHLLAYQYRMRPAISEHLVRSVYTSLQDHPSVFQRENIKGMDTNIFFMTHNKMEEEAEGMSKKNEFEALFVLNLSRYLLQQGYSPQEITILATYKGQTTDIEEKSKFYGIPPEIQITTVDNFQGEENKIILLSLVRSNPQNDVGFLKAENRVCVALSRARDGFYIFGNMDCFTARLRAWTVIKKSLIQQQSYGNALVLRCQVHKDQISEVTHLEDFASVAHGGCSMPCGHKLSCGHVCKSRCHGLTPHKRCREPHAREVEERRHKKCCQCTLL